MAYLVVQTFGACRDMHVLTLRQSQDQVSVFAHVENKITLYASLQKLNCGFCVCQTFKTSLLHFCFIFVLGHFKKTSQFSVYADFCLRPQKTKYHLI